MLTSFSEFKFYQSFRVPVERADDMRFLVERTNELGKLEYVNDAKLVDISVTGFGFSTAERISVGTELVVSLQFKKTHIDLSGRVVRAFANALEESEIIYGVELEEEKNIHKFLEQYISSFSVDRLKDCLIVSALQEKYTKATDGFEMFSLLLSLFKDITHFGNKEGFIDNMLEEVVRLMNAQRASIFLINPETNELEAITALGMDKDSLKFDYRLGIAGSVFTTGVALNIDTTNEKTRFNESFDKKFDFETRSIICHPIHNREDKIIGVIEVLNKRNQDRFTVEDEKTMKVLALVFSSVFHNYNPMSAMSQIRRFSTPFDRKHALIGKTAHVATLRNTIIKIKDVDVPVLIYGEHGSGKVLFGRILHHEGQRGLKAFETINCREMNNDRYREKIERELWGPNEDECKLTKCQGGTLLFKEISMLPIESQKKLYSIIMARGLASGKITLDVRIIATTTKDLGEMVDEGLFDSNLYDYLSHAYIFIEPLRRRLDDIDLLVDYFLKIECKKRGLLLKNFSPKAMTKMKEYDWPGNIRELGTCVQRAVLYNPKAHVITNVGVNNFACPMVDINVRRRMFGELPYVSDFNLSLKDRMTMMEKGMIAAEIKRHLGNKTKAAKSLGISREALRKKLLYSNSLYDELEDIYTKEKNDQEDKKVA